MTTTINSNEFDKHYKYTANTFSVEPDITRVPAVLAAKLYIDDLCPNKLLAVIKYNENGSLYTEVYL